MLTSIVVISALILDRLFGEPSRFHPLVGFGSVVDKLEALLNSDNVNAREGHERDGDGVGNEGDNEREGERKTVKHEEDTKSNTESNQERLKGIHKRSQKQKGVLAVFLAISPFIVVAGFVGSLLNDSPLLMTLFASVVLYAAIGYRSLIEHADRIRLPLSRHELPDARKAVGMIVSRDTENLEESDIAKAATESVLENGADAIFAAIFWYCLLGVPGVILYRLSNTLDAMWGYKNTRFLHFGWAAARLDDILNFIPARLTALSYALVGETAQAIRCWQQQGFSWKSPNAGPVMSAGAGAINVSLGGAAQYHNEIQQRQNLGPSVGDGGDIPQADSIAKACDLLKKSIVLWCLVIVVVDVWL